MSHGIYSYTYYNGTSANGPWSGGYVHQKSGTSYDESYGGLIAATQHWIKVVVTNGSGITAETTTNNWTRANAPTITVQDPTTWKQSKTVTIPALANHKIVYTTDGSEPTPSHGTATGAGASASFTINRDDQVVRAIYVLSSNVQNSARNENRDKKYIDNTPPVVTKIRFDKAIR